MKKLVLSLVCLCLFFIACGQKEIEKGKVKKNIENVYSKINSTEESSGKKQVYNDNGQVIVEKNETTGKILKYYFDGKKYKEVNYKEGMIQGEFNVFYANGNPFIKSIIDREFIVFDEEGNEKINGILTNIDKKFKLNYVDGDENIEKIFDSLEDVIEYSYSN
ncbi:hypothetical protein [Fusobacterium sp. MFO224]|uniref:hypothetical protein n=1 Tax=Fusobacterium sp. MFO224 TaxID=3378070 RepID=UPI003852815C